MAIKARAQRTTPHEPRRALFAKSWLFIRGPSLVAATVRVDDGDRPCKGVVLESDRDRWIFAVPCPTGKEAAAHLRVLGASMIMALG